MTRRQTSQSGSVFTILLAGIAIAGALSVVLYSTISGPMSSMVRVTNKTQAKSQMLSVASIDIMSASNASGSLPTPWTNGNCEGNGYVVPPAMRTGTVTPVGGGLIPTTIGAPVTDPWGTDYGYCAWEVGPGQTKCAAANSPSFTAENLLNGTTTPTAGTANSQVVIAIISAGPDRQFETTCAAYQSGSPTLPLVYPTATGAVANAANSGGGDDIVQYYTYQQASTATSSLWALSPTSASTAVIDKTLAVGPTGSPTVTVNPTTGLINALSVVTTGGIFSGGALGLALNDWTSPPSCVPGNEGNLYYNSTTLTMEVCNGATWTAAGSGGGGTLNTILAATAPGTLQDSGANPIIWNWNSLAGGNGLTLGSTSTAAAGNTQTLLNIALSGANVTPALTTYAEQVSNTHTGSGNNYGLNVTASGGSVNSGLNVSATGGGTTNYGLYVSASGATNNYAAIFNAGNVGIGTSTPAYPLDVGGVDKWW